MSQRMTITLDDDTVLELNVHRRAPEADEAPERPRRRRCRGRRRDEAEDMPEVTLVVDPDHDLAYRKACTCAACKDAFEAAYRHVAAGFAAAREIRIRVVRCAHDSPEYQETDMGDRRALGLCKRLHAATAWRCGDRAPGCAEDTTRTRKRAKRATKGSK